MLNHPPDVDGTNASPEHTRVGRAYLVLSITSLVAYVLASEGLRNFFLVTIPRLLEKLGRA